MKFCGKCSRWVATSDEWNNLKEREDKLIQGLANSTKRELELRAQLDAMRAESRARESEVRAMRKMGSDDPAGAVGRAIAAALTPGDA